MIGAFFDVDGTLYNANMWRGLTEYVSRHKRANYARIYYAALMPLYFMRKLRLISEETFRKPWVLNMGWMLRGWSEAEGDAAFQWIAEQHIRPSAREDVIARLREHVDKRHAVVLVSAMLAPTLRLVGEPLNVTGTVGTEIEIKDGRFTGRVLPPACMGIEKDRLTRRFLQARGIAIDYAASYAYADSISDLALFEMVGHPVAVYPDLHLDALARQKGWEIIQ